MTDQYQTPREPSRTTEANRPLVIAIDGPSGSGKSSTARGVAERLGLAFLDTGAMYRAITWLALQEGVDLDDQAAVADLLAHASMDIDQDPQRRRLRSMASMSPKRSGLLRCRPLSAQSPPIWIFVLISSPGRRS